MVTNSALEDRPEFHAIADPTRRAILDLLRDGEKPAGEIARHFPVSRPAIARHVGVLKRAGLVTERRQARQRFYALNPGGLTSIDRWIAPYRLFWGARLADLKRVVETRPDEETGP
ncbi:metalloregulator ArsR/SmtB family transcription factor [Maricaulis sp. CAU 1757]